MAAKLLLCCVLQTMLLCCVNECSALDKQSTMLSREAFARAEVSISETARPLERALFAFYFTNGSRDAVIAELAKFQNNDGGFASCLESDTRWCGSSPLGAMKALGILTDLGVPASEPHVKAVIRYLLASFDDQHGMWHALPKEANTAPHASWWEVREDTGKCEVESPLFPTAALAGYLRNYAALLPPGFLKRITESSLTHLAEALTPSANSKVCWPWLWCRIPNNGAVTTSNRSLSFTARSRRFIRKWKKRLVPIWTTSSPHRNPMAVGDLPGRGKTAIPPPGNWLKKSGEAWCLWKT